MKRSFIRPLGTFPQSPAPVQNLSATPVSSTEIDLTWNGIAGALNYTVRRNGNPIFTGLVTNYADTGLGPSTSYTYTVAAINSFGEGAQSILVGATTPAAPTVPSPVTSLTANPISTTEIDLSWPAASGSTNYIVSRNGSSIASPSVTSYADTGLTQATLYNYSVAGHNSVGNGAAATASATTLAAGGGPGSTFFIPGHRAWMDNFVWQSTGGNQRTQLVNTLSTLGNVNNLFNGVEICITPAGIADGTLDGNGNPTFNIGRTNVLDMLTLLKSVTTKKLYLAIKVVNGVFASTLPTTVRRDYFPAYMPQSWVKNFEQANGAFRQQLDFDNDAIWTNLQQIAAGLFSLVNELDTDNRIDIICPFNDESVVGNVSSTGASILNSANYCAKYGAFYTACKSLLPTRMLWNTLSYFPAGDATSKNTMVAQMAAAHAANPAGGVAFSGPDPSAYGIHGSGTNWATTAQDISTGVYAGLGDVRDSPGYAWIGHIEGFGGGTGSNFGTCPVPSGSNQQLWTDLMTRNQVAAHGNIGAHRGFGNNVMIWNFTSFLCLNQTAIISLVNSNGGATMPLNPGNWSTTP